MSLYLGIDIASIDGNKLVDWNKAKAAGVQFAIFRGTYIAWADPTWKKEADRARAVGLTVGAYLFPVMSDSAPSAESQVHSFAFAVGPLTYKDLPPTLDIEFPQGIKATGKTRKQLIYWIRCACNEFKRIYGISCMIYTSARVWDGQDEDSLNASLGVPTELLDCPLWLARYVVNYRKPALGDDDSEKSFVEALALPPVPKAWGPTNVWIHQYQGDSIQFSGFSSTVDVNRFFDLHQGCTGERVKWLQKKLKLIIDGQFGPKTFEAVKAYQGKSGLVGDGVVGPKTFAALCWAV